MRLFLWGGELLADDGRAWLAPAPVALGILSLLAGGRWGTFFVLSMRRASRHPERPPIPDSRCPRVTVSVPAHNEEETIEPAIRSLVALDYPNYEVHIVDDGSTDATHRRASRWEGSYDNCVVRVHRKPNGGKWSAHNLAFQRATGELILSLDADSELEPRALRTLVEHLMADPRLDAVAGQIRVRNRERVLTRLQALEYVMANGGIRMAQGHSANVLLVPGPAGLFRRCALEEVFLRYGVTGEAPGSGEVDGPFEPETFAEDFDLSVAILSLGGRIGYEPHAVSKTEAPDWPFSLLNQRYRWGRGIMQVLVKYFRRASQFPEVRHGRLLGWITLTYLFELLLLPSLYAIVLVFILPFLLHGGELLPMLGWSSLFWLLNMNAAAFFLRMHRDRLTLAPFVLLYDFYQAFFLNAAWAVAITDQLRGGRMRW